MSYNKPEQADLDALAAIVGRERCLTGEDMNDDYSHDELAEVRRFPDVVLRVTTTEEVSAIMRHAYARGIPVTVRGAGTGLVGGAVALEGGILIDTTLMNQILELDEDNLTVTVQPGALLKDVAQFAVDHDFFYPPDPGEKFATIGGNISTNAGGMRAVKYGVTRDYVRGLTAVKPDGTVLRLGGKVVKNSTGYSLKDLIVGSEGTLAVVTEAVLKLLPLPTETVSLLLPFATTDAALEMVPQIIKAKVIPTAIEYMPRETILLSEKYEETQFMDTNYEAYLLLTFDGRSMEQVEEEYARVAEFCLERGAEDAFVLDTAARKEAVWSARGAFLEAIKASTSEMDECDVVVPRSKIAEYIKFIHELTAESGVRIPNFGHAGDGNLHLYLCRDALTDQEWKEKLPVLFRRMYDKAAELGGLVSGEHGVGFNKREYMLRQYGEETVELMRSVKAAFDPKNILNPGKIV